MPETSLEERARALLGRTKPDYDELAELKDLEKALSVAEQGPLAREVRAFRVSKDKSLAIFVLSGELLKPEQMLGLAKRLADYKEIGYARRLLDVLREKAHKTQFPDVYREVFQKSAFFTYKDPDLPNEWRLDRALAILGVAEDLATTVVQETLGLAGAIYKRKWEVDAQRQNLELSLGFYLKGYAQGAPVNERADVLQYLRANPSASLAPNEDRGYCGINAAFMLDLLAHEDVTSAAAQRRDDARMIREEIARSIPPLKDAPGGKWLESAWWFYATIGEAHFGLKRFDEAIRWLVDEPLQAGLEVPEWEYESTARQLARLAQLQQEKMLSEEEFERTEVGRALKRFLKGDDVALRSAFRGKFGLALSGGGFRAAFFHIGLLAQLAERDLLRHVEVLSCVSGGSIVGAHYYLKLRHLLETKTDDEITPEDYVGIVRDLSREFLEGVQRNIRTRVLAELTTNLKMIFVAGYSRTLRVGELYEREIFSRANDGMAGVRWLDELFIHPLVGPGKQQTDFHPRNHNWRRKNKVPSLILNAASLNTGHNWQFTASYMGEPPMPINADIDSNERLRRKYYGEVPIKKMRLGHAVAASSCVPGLFEPLILDDLYPDRSVRLVDGGVCDNQGVRSLLEQDCSVLLVSDGSGQMESLATPSAGMLGVPLRSNSILQARVREAQYQDIDARYRSSLLRGLLFVHLKQGLPGTALAWTGCLPFRSVSDFEKDAGKRDRTRYGIDLSIQQQLAGIRTDLDSFSDQEAYALMTSGYRIAADQLESRDDRRIEGGRSPKRVDWSFLQIAADLAPEGANRPALGRLLDAGSQPAFKIWRLSKLLARLKWALAAVAAVAVAVAVWRWRDASLPSYSLGDVASIAIGFLGFAVMAAAVNAVLGAKRGRSVLRLIRPRETARNIALGIGMSVLGWLVARVHLHVFDPIFLRHGRMPAARPEAPPSAGRVPIGSGTRSSGGER